MQKGANLKRRRQAASFSPSPSIRYYINNLRDENQPFFGGAGGVLLLEDRDHNFPAVRKRSISTIDGLQPKFLPFSPSYYGKQTSGVVGLKIQFRTLFLSCAARALIAEVSRGCQRAGCIAQCMSGIVVYHVSVHGHVRVYRGRLRTTFTTYHRCERDPWDLELSFV